MQKAKVIALVGATSSGKTALGIYLAQKIKKAEILSADSRQVYTGLDIGTGKVTASEMAGVPHHLLNVASPTDVFTASDFVRIGTQTLQEIITRGNTPIVVGGSGFYIDTLLGRMTLPEVEPNETLRTLLEKKSAPELFLLLEEKDPERALTIDRHNPRRLIRALEIAEALGKNPTPHTTTPYEVLWLGIDIAQPTLFKRIHTRLLSRITDGMVEEAITLHKEGLSYARMEMLGLEYRFLAELLQKKITKEVFVTELYKAICAYAKRQYTWFKKNPNIKWVRTKKEALEAVSRFLGK